MLATSDLWKSIIASGDFNVQTVAVIGGKAYNTINAPVRRSALLSGDDLSVGNCVAGTLEFTLMTTDTISKSAKVEIWSRVTDGDKVSEWVTMGTYWINHRSYTDDLIDLECYDAMMFGRQVYEDDSQSMTWPKSMSEVVNRIAKQMGLGLDSRTTIPTGDMYKTVTMPGENEDLLDILGHIGAVLGGNWIITPENKLRLVPLVDIPSETNTSSDTNDAGGTLINVPVVIGSMDTGDSYTISRVTMSFDQDHTYTAGNDTGYELVIEGNSYVSQALCNALYSRVNGITYAPFSLTRCCYDPAAELGDWIVCSDVVRSVLYNEIATFDVGFRADISAPQHGELEDEFPYKSAYERMGYEVQALSNDNAAIRSEISQLPGQILLSVSETYATQEYVSSIMDATLVSDTLNYLATDLSTGVTTDTAGWTTTPQTVDASHKYLWTYHSYEYGDGSTSNSSPAITGMYGAEGLSVTEIVPLYYAKSNTTAPSKPTSEVTRTTTTGGQWTRAIPALSSSYPYMFTCDQVKYSDGTYTWTDVVRDNATTDLNNRITTINNDYAPKGQIRSLFAMDASSITIQSGTIAFTSDSISVDSTNFSLTSDGKMKCNGAEISGEFSSTTYDEYGDAHRLEFADAELRFKASESTDGPTLLKLKCDTAVYRMDGDNESGNQDLVYAYDLFEIVGIETSSDLRTGIAIHTDNNDSKMVLDPDGNIEITANDCLSIHAGTIKLDNLTDALPSGSFVTVDSKEITVTKGFVTAISDTTSGPYPVGSIYISVYSTNPSYYFGGTWVAFAQGRVLIGVGTGTDTNEVSKDFYSGATGGEYSHTLTIDEMPRHQHSFNTGGATVNKGTNYNRPTNATSYSSSHVYQSSPRGSSQPFEMLPPYIAVYMWQRTA